MAQSSRSPDLEHLEAAESWTCSVELQRCQDVCGVQLHSERWDVHAPRVAPGADALEEDGPGPADQVQEGVLQDT